MQTMLKSGISWDISRGVGSRPLILRMEEVDSAEPGCPP